MLLVLISLIHQEEIIQFHSFLPAVMPEQLQALHQQIFSVNSELNCPILAHMRFNTVTGRELSVQAGLIQPTGVPVLILLPEAEML